MRFYQGSSLTEYTISGILIAVVCIGGLMQMSNGTKDLIGSLKGDLEKRQTESNQLANSPVAVIANPAANAADGSGGLTGGTGTAESAASALSSLNNSTSVDGITSSGDTSRNLDVGGANGNTTLLASQLETLAKSLYASGQITQEQENKMLALADQGHRLSGAEALLEDAYASGAKSVTFEGKKYSLQDFADQLGTNTSINPADPSYDQKVVKPFLNMDPSVLMGVNKPFGQAYQALLASGALSNPAVQQQVSTLSSQIMVVSDSLGWAYSDLDDQGKTKDMSALSSALQSNYDFYNTKFGVAKLEVPSSGQSTASAATDSNSTKICQQGDASGSCKAN